MDFYSFQYPPRPIPSEAHRPGRYYFHNLDQDHAPILKNKALGFQKEGVSPNVAAITIHTRTGANAFTMNSERREQGQLLPPPSLALSLSSSGSTMGGGSGGSGGAWGLEVLDRSNFLVQ
ncbi:hypothetical protein BG011_007753 [Mortierella polycephala]|uniref:Uncharacterized protein n=1 Tax=Mortierella polycephala TaxID=41804 RepID=A0A9P6PRE2_9FUNG|nr:hypothetical protein BG011_007753 [Mortierella polycephala]